MSREATLQRFKIFLYTVLKLFFCLMNVTSTPLPTNFYKRGYKIFSLLEELNNQFRLTLFSARVKEAKLQPWEDVLVQYLRHSKSITPKEAVKIWKVSDRTVRFRLKIMTDEGILQRIATSNKDPRAVFILSQ